MARIYPKKIKSQTYYYYQHTYRVKIDPSMQGKKKGTGKSKVCTDSVFLGTADSIFERLNKTKKPVEVMYKEFGFVAAGYQAADKIGLIDILKKHIKGKSYEIPRWIYFLVTILNRLDYATSKAQMGKWAAKTFLPQLLNFDPKTMNSKTFWYATEDVISEKDLNKRRVLNSKLEDDLLVGLNTEVFQAIENDLWPNIYKLLNKSIETLIYDTTNFFTYIEEPVSSWLAKTGNNKASRHHLKQVGLAMAVDKEWGIPLFHRLYRGNSQDVKTFKGIITDLLNKIKSSFSQIEDIVLVLDKGNNSKDNFKHLDGEINWVGSLMTSRYQELVEKDISEYNGQFERYKYFRVVKEVMGVKCVIVVTYNEDLYRKQEYSLQSGIKRLKKKIQTKYDSYKRQPIQITRGMRSIQDKDHYGKYIKIEIKQKKIFFTDRVEKIEERRKRLGKNLIFSNNTKAESAWIISQYREKEIIEDDFKILNNPELVRFRPVRHWTDTKICALGFCNIMSLVLLKFMQIKTERSGLKMSPLVLKEELKDLKEVIMIYKKDSAERQISRRSSVQQKLWELFELMHIENAVNHTQSS